MIIPNICKNKTCSKPPTSYHCDILILPCCWRNPWRAFSVNRFHRFHPTLVTIQPWTSMVSKLTNYQFSQTSESPETQKNSSESTQFPMATRTEDDWGDRSPFLGMSPMSPLHRQFLWVKSISWIPQVWSDDILNTMALSYFSHSNPNFIRITPIFSWHLFRICQVSGRHGVPLNHPWGFSMQPAENHPAIGQMHLLWTPPINSKPHMIIIYHYMKNYMNHHVCHPYFSEFSVK